MNHDILPDPEHEMIEIALRQIQRLEKKVAELETELKIAREEISAESERTSALEANVVDDKNFLEE